MGAFIREIFSSVQGEGPYLGCRQIFIRFSGCNLSCRYCDTLRLAETGRCSVEVRPGKRKYVEMPNPLSAEGLMDILEAYFPLPIHHSASMTGGEPLMQAAFLKQMLPALKNLNMQVYLETNGSLPERLSQVIDLVDIISMDIKLPGNSGCGPLWERHRQFLSIASRSRVFVKIVMDDPTPLMDFEKALDLVAGVDDGITLVIQPVTVGGKCALSPDRALELQAMGLKLLKDVRVIPQAHVMMNQL